MQHLDPDFYSLGGRGPWVVASAIVSACHKPVSQQNFSYMDTAD